MKLIFFKSILMLALIFISSCEWNTNPENLNLKSNTHIVKKDTNVYVKKTYLDNRVKEILFSPDYKDTVHVIEYTSDGEIKRNEGDFFYILMKGAVINNKLKVTINSVNIPNLNRRLVLIKRDTLGEVKETENYIIYKNQENYELKLRDFKLNHPIFGKNIIEILSVNEDLSLKIKIDDATKNIFFGELV